MRECDKYFLQIRDNMDIEGVDCKIKRYDNCSGKFYSQK